MVAQHAVTLHLNISFCEDEDAIHTRVTSLHARRESALGEDCGGYKQHLLHQQRCYLEKIKTSYMKLTMLLGKHNMGVAIDKHITAMTLTCVVVVFMNSFARLCYK